MKQYTFRDPEWIKFLKWAEMDTRDWKDHIAKSCEILYGFYPERDHKTWNVICDIVDEEKFLLFILKFR